MNKHQPTLCYLCEKPLTGDCSRDHIPPSQMFDSNNLPSNLYTLPTHADCNGRLSEDEEYFKIIMLVQAPEGQGDALNVWHGPVLRQFNRTRSSGFTQMISEGVFQVSPSMPNFSNEGAFIGDSVSLRYDARRIKNVFEKIVRGLYWKHIGALIGPIVLALRSLDRQDGAPTELMKPFIGSQLFDCGNSVLEYLFWIPDNNSGRTMWAFSFYEGPVHIVCTSHPEIPEMDPKKHDQL